MDKLKDQNLNLRKIITQYEEVNQKLKQENQKKIQQIQALLQFNQRLVKVIESVTSKQPTTQQEQQQNNAPPYDNNWQPLRPISEKSQRDSEIAGSYRAGKSGDIFLMKLPQKRNTTKYDAANQLTSLNFDNRNTYDPPRTKQYISGDFTRKAPNAARGNSEQFQQIYALIEKYREQIDLGQLKSLNQSNRNINSLKPSERYAGLRQQFENGMSQWTALAQNNIHFCQQKIKQLDKLSSDLKEFEPIKKLQRILRNNGRQIKK